MIVDLHCHTTASDGTLSPPDLLARAIERNVELLAVTDHDTMAAYEQLDAGSLKLVPGIELSCQWQKSGIHIVGLNVDINSNAMTAALEHQHSAREQRAELIAARLEKYGVTAPLEGARQLAGNTLVGRPHFARYLAACGFVKSEKEAFKKFLGSGKTCDIRVCWPETAQVVEWIRDAGGTAVLAHPGKYSFTRSKLLKYLEEFSRCGGAAMEIYSGPQTPNITQQFSAICEQFKLQESVGSDFHSPVQRWLDLGVNTQSLHLRNPVWAAW